MTTGIESLRKVAVLGRGGAVARFGNATAFMGPLEATAIVFAQMAQGLGA